MLLGGIRPGQSKTGMLLGGIRPGQSKTGTRLGGTRPGQSTTVACCKAVPGLDKARLWPAVRRYQARTKHDCGLLLGGIRPGQSTTVACCKAVSGQDKKRAWVARVMNTRLRTGQLRYWSSIPRRTINLFNLYSVQIGPA
jgi:hypothetical protein